jgi:hypothetical protein
MKIIVLVAMLLSLVSGCVGLREELDKMAVVKPPPGLVEESRQWAREKANFKCPPTSTFAYVLAEINLASNETRAGIRCK